MAKLVDAVDSKSTEGNSYRSDSDCEHHIETIGLVPKISVLFSFYRTISLILGMNRLIFGGVAFFSLPVLKAGNLSKARTSNVNIKSLLPYSNEMSKKFSNKL